MNRIITTKGHKNAENGEKRFPKTRIAWLWENMEGYRGLYVVAMLGTVLYNVLQLTVPYFSGQIIDLFLTGEQARQNMQENSALFYRLIIIMIGLTLVRTTVVYFDCMAYEKVSQSRTWHFITISEPATL